MNNAATASAPSVQRAAHAGKYLTFALGAEEYGLPILKVCEIIRYVHITPVPGSAVDMGGVINLRGQVIAVTDLRAKFSMKPTDRTERACIIIVELSRGSRSSCRTGILVDSVSEVLDLPDSDIEEAPVLGPSAPPAFVLGIARRESSVKILLNVDSLLGREAA